MFKSVHHIYEHVLIAMLILGQIWLTKSVRFYDSNKKTLFFCTIENKTILLVQYSITSLFHGNCRAITGGTKWILKLS